MMALVEGLGGLLHTQLIHCSSVIYFVCFTAFDDILYTKHITAVSREHSSWKGEMTQSEGGTWVELTEIILNSRSCR